MSRRSARLATLAAAVALVAATAADAGAGLRSGGDTLYSTRVGYLFATQAWDADRRLYDSRCRSEYTSFSHALEHGWSYYNTVYGQLSLAQSACDEDSRNGISDLRLGLRGRLNVYENNGSWELEATIPTDRDAPGERRLGCGEYGLAGNLHKRHEFGAWDVDYGSSLQLWDSPLAHQLRAYTGFGRKLARRWSWGAGVQGAVPVSDGVGDPGALLSDCGTEGKHVRLNADVKYRQSDFLHLGCGLMQTVWGEEVSRTRGMSCGFTYLWKD